MATVHSISPWKSTRIALEDVVRERRVRLQRPREAALALFSAEVGVARVQPDADHAVEKGGGELACRLTVAARRGEEAEA